MSNVAYQIYELLNTMDPTEKSYVKKTFSSNEKNMSQLFDDLNKCAQFNKKIFLRRYKTRPYMKYLSQNCNYLLKRITKSLIDYNTENLTEINIMARLSSISLLVKKGMFSACVQKIDKEIELADTHQYYDYGYKLIKLKERFYKIYMMKEFSYARHLALAKKKKFYVHQLQLIDELELLNVAMHCEDLTNSNKIELAQSKFKELKLTDKESITQLPLVAKRAFNYTSYKVSQLKGKSQLAYLKQSLIDYNEQPLLKPIYFENYVHCIANYLIGLIIEKNYTLFFIEHEKYLIELKNYPKWKTMKTSPFYHIIKYYLYIVACVQSKNANRAVNKAKKYLVIIKRDCQKLMDYFVYDALSNIALTFFNVGRIDETLNAIDQLKTHKNTEAQYFYRVVQILCHYKLDNVMLVHSLLNALGTYLRKNNKPSLLKDFLKLKKCLLSNNCHSLSKLKFLPHLDLKTLKKAS